MSNKIGSKISRKTNKKTRKISNSVNKIIKKTSNKQSSQMMNKKTSNKKVENCMNSQVKKTKKQAWIEIIPYGIVGGMVPEASTMLFKRKAGKGHFIVWLSDLQSRMAIDQSLNKEQPFRFVQKILEKTETQIKNCFFIKTDQGRDIVAITFEGGKSIKPIRFYADEVISFCILNKCKFFCTDSFLKQNRRDLPKRFRKKDLEKRPMYLN